MNLTKDIILLTENIHWLTKDQAWHYRVLPENKTKDHFILYCEAETQRRLWDGLASEPTVSI
ncbi:hypothetical protein [uncultured Mucilaginibacter sp.]|uniref:hypothetical protein n=1 Tax=uncultured Mucilaginibacter sp. TaxID=797541 RepID=UPI0025F1B2CB|nr:hypothetical protein [uncultured Mucilaginibacter sp.]